MNSLTIRISHDRIIFANYDRLQNLVPEYEVYTNNPDISLNANVCQAIKMIGLGQGDYNFVDVYIDSQTTLVPLNEFEEEYIDDIFFYNFPSLRQRNKVFYDTLPYLNALLLFTADKDVVRTLRDYFPGVKFHSTLTALVIQYAARYPYTATTPRIYCYLCENQLTTIVINSGKLAFMNTYKIHNPNDALYFLNSVAERVGYEHNQERIYIGGDQQASAKLIDNLPKINMQGRLMDDRQELSNHPISKIADFPYDFKVVLLKAY